MAPADLDLIKRRNPIERVMAAHGVKLEKRGGRFLGCCPFHEEQHPSLVVYPETRSFYCFGCRASGDVIDFVRRKEGLNFKEALRRLGNGAVRERQGTASQPTLTVDDQLILAAASNLYHQTLLEEGPVLRYLEGEYKCFPVRKGAWVFPNAPGMKPRPVWRIWTPGR